MHLRQRTAARARGDDCWLICFHAQTYGLLSFAAMARALDFGLPREKGFSVPLLVDVCRPISNERLPIPRERNTKISRTRNSILVGGAINLRHENDRVSKSVPATHAHGLYHNLADRHGGFSL